MATDFRANLNDPFSPILAAIQNKAQMELQLRAQKEQEAQNRFNSILNAAQTGMSSVLC